MTNLSRAETGSAPKQQRLRIASFNVSLHRSSAGQLLRDLQSGDNRQARQIAEILQRVRPDIVLLNEFDYPAELAVADRETSGRLFVQRFLNRSQNGQRPLDYPHLFVAPVNTGVASHMDLDGDGKSDGPADAFGFGRYPGQYGMLILSRFPIQRQQVRTFQKFLWKDMPHADLPHVPATGKPFYQPQQWELLRLSSKSMWDVPIQLPGSTLHLIAAHPTPPVFDGAEDRNGCRNHDEIRLIADYLSPTKGHYLYDDKGMRGGLPAEAAFVVAGDLNADPHDGDSRRRAIWQLLDHPRINNHVAPSSRGGIEAAQRDGQVNKQHAGNPAEDTSDFDDGGSGNLRIDYLLPSQGLKVLEAGCFWPTADEPTAQLLSASDHRLIWLDLQLDAVNKRD